MLFSVRKCSLFGSFNRYFSILLRRIILLLVSHLHLHLHPQSLLHSFFVSRFYPLNSRFVKLRYLLVSRKAGWLTCTPVLSREFLSSTEIMPTQFQVQDVIDCVRDSPDGKMQMREINVKFNFTIAQEVILLTPSFK